MRTAIVLAAIIAALVTWFFMPRGGALPTTPDVNTATVHSDSTRHAARPETSSTPADEPAARSAIVGGKTEPGSWLLRGTVRSSKGGPLDGAKITVSVYFFYRNVEIGSTTTGPDGTYRYDVSELRLRPAADRAAIAVEATASAAGHDESSRRRTLRGIAADRPHEFEASFELHPLCRAIGRIIDRHGNPVTGAEVMFEESPASDLEWEPDVTGADGRFAIGIAPGSLENIQITARHPRHGRAVRKNLELDEGKDVDFGDIVLEAVSELRARILDRHGRALSRARINFIAEDTAGPMVWTRTDAAGALVVRTLQPGRYRIVPDAWHAGKDTLPLLATGDDGHELRIDAVRLRLTFIDEEGTRVTPHQVRGAGYAADQGSTLRGVLVGDSLPTDLPTMAEVWSTEGNEFYVPADTWWWFRTSDHDPGVDGGALVHAAPGRSTIDVPITVRPIRRTARVVVQATVKDGSAPPKLIPWFEPLQPTRVPRWAEIGSGPGELILQMTPGRFRMSLRTESRDQDHPSPFLPFVAPVDVIDGAEPQRFDVVLRRGGHASVIVRLPQGAEHRKLAGFALRLLDGDDSLTPYQYLRGEFWTSSDDVPSDAPIRSMRVLPAGRHTLVVETDDFGPATVSVLIEQGKVTRTEVWLRAR